jgi:hypothetical protein
LGEHLHHLAAFLAAHPAMHQSDGFGLTDVAADAFGQVVEDVAAPVK